MDEFDAVFAILVEQIRLERKLDESRAIDYVDGMLESNPNLLQTEIRKWAKLFTAVEERESIARLAVRCGI